MQILPSTTDNESGITGKGLKVFRSADWMKSIFTCMLPASFCPETLNDAYLFRSISGALIVAHILALQNQVPKAYEMSFKIRSYMGAYPRQLPPSSLHAIMPSPTFA